MNKAVKELRQFFKSQLWTDACFDDQPIVSDQGIVGGKGIELDTKINLALDFEGQFNEMAHKYMKWRKENKLNEEQ